MLNLQETKEITSKFHTILSCNIQSYSEGRMKFNISKELNFSGYIKSIKTCNIPLKTRIKIVTMNAEKN